MPRSPDEKALTDRLSKRYQLSQSEIALGIERCVLGCDYGGTSWATRQEVDALAGLMGLGPGRRLLDIGAGSGWPSLYWARTTGCDVALADVPLSALRIAADRAAVDQASGACWVVAADGASLPFESGSFDAVSHSDVLCCLEAKHSVLKECRRVIRAGGVMAFTVIVPARNLAPADHERSVQFGPPFAATATDYRAMLRESRWKITHYRDLTAEYAKAVRHLLREEEAHADALIELYGAAEFSETLERRRMTAQIAGNGHLRRELFSATTA